MRKFPAIFITLLLLAVLTGAAHAVSTVVDVQDASGQYHTREVPAVSIVLDGQLLESDIPAFIMDSRTLVPVRIISEHMGASVTWKADTRQVLIENSSTSITLTIGSPLAVVNGQTVELYDGVPATMAAVGSLTRTMVPLRFLSEQMGATVEFDGETSTVIITSPAEETYGLTAPLLEDGVLTVAADPEAEVRIFTLTGRVVADFPGGVLSDSSFGKVTVDGTAIAAVRYNQYDQGYDVSRVARVVFDLQDGYSVDDLLIDFEGGLLTVLQPEGPETPEEPETPKEPEVPEEPLAPLIVLDAGHGGSDTGAPYFGYDEKDLVLPMTLAVGEILEEAGYRVEYTRSDDTYVSLAARAEQANTQQADIFVSIHANAFPQKPELNGLETYYLVGGDRSKVLAESIHEAVLASTGANDREIRTASYYVLKYTDMPAVLVETGYMSNEEECSKLADPAYQALVAQGIANGIMAYLGPAAAEQP